MHVGTSGGSPTGAANIARRALSRKRELSRFHLSPALAAARFRELSGDAPIERGIVAPIVFLEAQPRARARRGCYRDKAERRTRPSRHSWRARLRRHRSRRRIRARAVHVGDLDDDRGYVIQPAAAVRLGDELMHLLVRRPTRDEQRLEPAIVDHPGEPIARDEEDVAELDLATVDVGLDVGTRADAARNDVAVWVVARLLRREETGVHLLLHVRVILRHLRERTVAEQIHARVADLTDEIPPA